MLADMDVRAPFAPKMGRGGECMKHAGVVACCDVADLVQYKRTGDKLNYR